MHLKNRIYILLPIFIFIILFILDKLILIPQIRNCCVTKIMQFDPNFEEMLEQKIKKSSSKNKKLALNFGSSLSYGYYYTGSKEFYEANIFLNESEKAKLREWEIVNLASPGSSILSIYILLNNLLDKGIKPDLISIELNPSSLNGNSPWYDTEIIEQIPIGFAIKNLDKIPFNHLRKLFLSRIFVLTRFKIGLPNQNYNIGKDFFWKFVFNYYIEDKIQLPPASYKDGDKNFSNQDVIKGLEKNFQNFTINKDLEQYFHLILSRLQTEKIPTIFWYPTLSKEAQAISRKNIPEHVWAPIKNELKLKNFQYVDLNSVTERKCDYFLDPTHMGYQCYAEAFLIKLNKLNLLGK